MAKIAKKYEIWFHVDAAWGGALLLSKKFRPLISGIEEADSISFDGHKFMYLTISHSAILFKNQKSLHTVRQSANYILREGSIDLGRTSLEGSRRFDSFKLWFALKVLGRSGYEQLINSAVEKGKLFYEMIDAHPDFEVTSDYFSGIVTYRFIPKKFQPIFQNEKDKKNLTVKEIEANEFINKINIEIQKKQRSQGKSFVSRTILESIFQGQEIVVLRALAFNPLTNKHILSEILMEQAELGKTIVKREKNIANTIISS